MGAQTEDLTRRLLAGEDISPDQLAAAESFDRLTDLRAETDARRASDAAELERLRRIEDQIETFRDETDDEVDRLRVAYAQAVTALAELNAQVAVVKNTVSTHCTALVALGFPIHYDDIVERTGGRVIFSLDHLIDPHPVKVPITDSFFTWVDRRRVEREEL